MSEIASRFRRMELDAQAERAVAAAVRESEGSAPAHPNTGVVHDPYRMRGIPCMVQGGVGGAIAGTRPDAIR